MFYRYCIAPLLFLLPAETAHRVAMRMLVWVHGSKFLRNVVRRVFAFHSERLELDVWGRRLANPIGLAAGFDKDAEAFLAFASLGFGWVEVGTLTPRGQQGNPKPRLFRLKRDRALLNRMGFNNVGAQVAAAHLTHPDEVVLGVNVGKNADTAIEKSEMDYLEAARCVAKYADYLVVNLSSPNTPGLRTLQNADFLRSLLPGLRQVLDSVHGMRRVPLFIKIASDIADQDALEIADLAVALKVDGLILVNTTLSREGLKIGRAEIEALGAGGISGPPLAERTLALLKLVYGHVGGSLVLVSGGGIEHADDVWQRLCSGASLVQIYTALVYGGPGLVGDILKELDRRVSVLGLVSIKDVIGRRDLEKRFESK